LPEPLLTVSGLSVSYGPILAVRDLHLEIPDGEVVALLGPNGAGKSSTLKALVGLTPCSADAITLGGTDIRAARTEARVRLGMALSPEGRQVFDGLTVAENLRLGGAVSDRSAAAEIEEEITQLFPILRERRNQLAGTLSGGQQQQLAIARALMSRPRLLMLDEPSLGLAPRIVDDIFALIANLRDRGITIIVVEQNVTRALEVADRGYVLEGGKLVLSGSAAELRGAEDQLVGAYLGLEAEA
jgi:branched-chain amino acid transport system ATP-binding protein